MSTKTRGKTKSNWTKTRPHRSAPPSGPRRRSAPTPRGRSRRPATRRPVSTGWIVFGLLAASFAVGFVVLGGRSPEGGGAAGGVASDFTLASTAGGSVSLADYRGRNVLLYFNEGVGCDACFYQTAELERNADELANAGVTVLPIVMNPAADTAGELQRFGLSTPYLIDANGSVSRAYGMLGKGMHSHLPGHGFVLVDGSGEVRWTMEYPSMFVSAGDLLEAVEPFLG